MRKYIKIGDIIIFLILLILVIGSSVLMFSYVNKKDGNKVIEITFKNELVDKIESSSVFEEKIDIKYVFEYQKGDDFIKVYKNDSLFKEISYKENKDFKNVISIKDGVIKMIEASCNGKDCMRLEINKDKILPIICTNGVCVKVNDDNSEIDILA